MTDAPAESGAQTEAKTGADKRALSSQGARLIVDVGPIVVWMIAYNLATRLRPDEAVFIATGVYMVATLAALAYARLREKRWPLMLLVTAVIVTLFGGAALVFHNALFAYIKPTIINLMFAVAIFGSLAVRQNVLKLVFGGALELPERAWRELAVRWGLWFVFLALLNEVVWRGFPEAFWANFKVFGVLPLTFLFALANAPLVMRHMSDPDAEGAGGPGAESKQPD